MKFLATRPSDTRATFNCYVGEMAKQALLGPSAANRILEYGEGLLSLETQADLRLISEGDRPPNVPVNNDNLEDTIPALVRTIHDFGVGDQIRYHTAEQATRWSQGIVYLGHISLINMSKGSVCATDDTEDDDEAGVNDRGSRGVIIVNHFGDNGVYFSPNWPALMPEALNDAVQCRKRNGLQGTTWRRYVRALVGLSFFDEQALDPVFQTAIQVTLRHIDAPPSEKRPSQH